MKRTNKILVFVALITILCLNPIFVFAEESISDNSIKVESTDILNCVEHEDKNEKNTLEDAKVDEQEIKKQEEKSENNIQKKKSEEPEESSENKEELIVKKNTAKLYKSNIESTEEYEKVLEDGEYRIKSQKNDKRYLCIENNSNNNEAKIVLQNYTNESNYIFRIKSCDDGCYTITAINSSKVIDVPGASHNIETKLHQYESNGTDAQKWKITPNDNGSYSLISKCNNLYWDLPGASTEVGTKIQMYYGNGTVAQQFVFEKVIHQQGTKTIEDGDYKISLGINSNKYLGLENESKKDGAKIVVKDYTEDSNLVFNVKYLNNGYYEIKSVKSNKSIDVPGASRDMEIKIQQYSSNGTDAQKWIIREVEENRYTVISKCNDLCWDIPGGRDNNRNSSSDVWYEWNISTTFYV